MGGRFGAKRSLFRFAAWRPTGVYDSAHRWLGYAELTGRPAARSELSLCHWKGLPLEIATKLPLFVHVQEQLHLAYRDTARDSGCLEALLQCSAPPPLDAPQELLCLP